MISYGGIKLLDATPELSSWVSRNIPTGRVYDQTSFAWLGDAARDSRWPLRELADRPVDCGVLRWTWGASRWACGHFLCDEARLERIRRLVYGLLDAQTYNPLEFVMDDERGGVLTTDLYMLPAHPLSTLAVDSRSATTGLYLMTLVDARFFWWEKAQAITVTENTTTWAQLYSAIGSALGVTITPDTVAAAYLKPSAELGSRIEYLPPLLDAVAASVGQRIARKYNGTVLAMGAAAAKTLAYDQLTTWSKLAGGPVPIGVA